MSKYKKIAFVLPDASGGGAERTVVTLADQFQSLGHEVHIFLLANRIAYKLPENSYVHVLSETMKITHQKQVDVWLLSYRLKRLINHLDNNFDLILSNLPDADRVVAKAQLKKVVYVMHNAQLVQWKRWSASKVARRKRRMRGIYKNARMIAVSTGLERELRAIDFGAKSIKTIYNPFEIEKIKQLANKTVKGKPMGDYLIFIGRHVWEKDLDTLLDAYVKINTALPLVMLTKPSLALDTLVNEQGLRGKILFPGFQENPYAWIKSASLLISSSLSETLHNVLIEALICGTPVVATNCEHGPNEILTGDLAKWLVPVGDSGALANKIKEALATDIKITDECIKQFDAETIANQYLALAND